MKYNNYKLSEHRRRRKMDMYDSHSQADSETYSI